MSVKVSPFGKDRNGRDIKLFTLTNAKGYTASFTDYGARLVGVTVPDREGKARDVVLGQEDVSGYLNNSGCLGATVGRYANRIARGAFTLNGTKYTLFINNGPNTLHGGKEGFDKKWFQSEYMESEREDCLIFTYIAHDMEEGFPGRLHFQVAFTRDIDCVLTIRYLAQSDKDTVVNFTNHAYFNLNGHDSGDIKSQVLALAAPLTTEVDDGLIPTGGIANVFGSSMDFTGGKPFGKVFDDPHPLVTQFNGLDFNYLIPGDGLRFAASLYAPESGIFMNVRTTEPGIQVYSGQGLHQDGKAGAYYGAFAGLALETQHFPDSPNHPDFPSTLLPAGATFESTTEYAFTVKD